MNREIKFRGWHGTLNRMIEGLTVKNSLAEWKDENGKWWIFESDIMQFTGLKDKNGKEIFEGDRVKRIKDEIEGVVFWQYGAWRVKVDGAFDSDLYHWICYCDGTEVIGNIYEHPELVK